MLCVCCDPHNQTTKHKTPLTKVTIQRTQIDATATAMAITFLLFVDILSFLGTNLNKLLAAALVSDVESDNKQARYLAERLNSNDDEEMDEAEETRFAAFPCRCCFGYVNVVIVLLLLLWLFTLRVVDYFHYYLFPLLFLLSTDSLFCAERKC